MQRLAGRKIVVTRPRDQAKTLLEGITQLGGQALFYPLLNISAIPDNTVLQQQIQRLPEFDLAVFISPNAVLYGMAAINRLLPHNLRIAAVGAGTAKALQQQRVTDVLLPSDRFDSEGLLRMPALQQVAGQRVIIFRGETGRELLGDTLRQRGATVEYASCYQRNKPDWTIDALLQAQPDAITVTSSEALGYLNEMMGADRTLQQLPLFVIHPRIAEYAQQQGWHQVIVTATGDAGLLQGVQDWVMKAHKDKV